MEDASEYARLLHGYAMLRRGVVHPSRINLPTPLLSYPAALAEILERADAAYTSGDIAQARLHHHTAINAAPDCVDAWLGLSRVTPQLNQRRTALQRVLSLDSANAEALVALATV